MERKTKLIVQPFEDPANEGNNPKHHTGKVCIEGCGRPAGTWWSPYWCFDCNVTRMQSISANLEAMAGPNVESSGTAGISKCRVKCDKCGREQGVDGAKALARGWPECHGYTMTLLRPNDPSSANRRQKA